jgi:hypothetical protein
MEKKCGLKAAPLSEGDLLRSGWVEALDFDAFAADAGDHEADDFVAFLHDFHGGSGGTAGGGTVVVRGRRARGRAERGGGHSEAGGGAERRDIEGFFTLQK